ncbi:MAG: AAA family ATPase [Rhodoferax sp.]|jgi:NadR type nicotinamide-nucleotide adenylyltransferase|uniref:AAA family ATPase n=1 Tax=Rhodoferax sp. TaxID=50421 RepID=UPI001B778BD1|nr:AAA family ATPase [Rhodoferax sp.]MBP9735108.1 AAA family ATPase [Rhodoferax sp.]
MNRTIYQHGLVIGKFYPPHLGHEYLIRTAAAHCKCVTVAVLGSSVESLSIAQRVQWLQMAFAAYPQLRIVGELDDVAVDYDNPAIWQAHVDLMRQAVQRADAAFGTAPPVDAVFTSEGYGDELARRFSCDHVGLDQTRALYPTSGTAVRSDVCAQREMLSPTVQAGLALRVVVVGAESSGTTTLSCDLVNALRARGGVWARTQWVAEFGREYSANLLALARAKKDGATVTDIDWCTQDFSQVAGEQCWREETAARHGSPILVCDTDAWATLVWHERYMGCASAEVQALAHAMPPRALYVLTSDVDVPFEDDGLRDGKHLRAWMTQRFRTLLQQQPVPWVELCGTPQVRCAAALAAIDAAALKAWQFAAPLDASFNSA